MSQFLLLANPNMSKIPEWVQVSNVSDDIFYSRAKTAVFTELDSPVIAIVKPFGQDFDNIFIQAQHSLLEGASLDSTLLYRTIMEVEQYVDAMAFWYGADFEGLDKVHNIHLVFDEIKHGLSESSVEAYILFINNRKR